MHSQGAPTMNELETFEIEPQDTLESSVVWLHGLGATPHDFDDVVPLLNLRHTRFVFPAAPERPVTVNGGMVMPAWYDLLSLGEPPLREDAASVRASADLMSALLRREIARGVAAQRLVLMGFSQGGALALHVGTRFPERLAGLCSLSGYLLQPETFDTERSTSSLRTPVLICHGEFDPVVPVSLGKSSFETLKGAGYEAEWRSFAMPHSLCLDEVRALGQWFERCGVR
jgi:phospholipase/carboxylesterase